MRIAIAALLIGCSPPADAVEKPADAAVDAHMHDAVVDGHRMPDASKDVSDAMEEPPPPVPETLAETGLYKEGFVLADGVVLFDVAYPLWSDGAEKSRYLLLPPGTAIDKSNPDHWTYPKGTRAWKEFRRDGKRVETRFLEKTGEGSWGWRYVAYAWSEDQKTATAARKGSKNALGTAHDIPSQEQCDQCHSGTRDGLIGPGAYQWKQVEPPGTGVVKEVLGYLHGNCGYCHSDEGRWASARKLRTKLRVGDTEPEKTPTYLTTVNVDMAHADIKGSPYIGIVPGAPDRSHLVMRMERRDGVWDMPPVGSEVVDTAAASKVREWITAMK